MIDSKYSRSCISRLQMEVIPTSRLATGGILQIKNMVALSWDREFEIGEINVNNKIENILENPLWWDDFNS